MSRTEFDFDVIGGPATPPRPPATPATKPPAPAASKPAPGDGK